MFGLQEGGCQHSCRAVHLGLLMLCQQACTLINLTADKVDTDRESVVPLKAGTRPGAFKAGCSTDTAAQTTLAEETQSDLSIQGTGVSFEGLCKGATKKSTLTGRKLDTDRTEQHLTDHRRLLLHANRTCTHFAAELGRCRKTTSQWSHRCSFR